MQESVLWVFGEEVTSSRKGGALAWGKLHRDHDILQIRKLRPREKKNKLFKNTKQRSNRVEIITQTPCLELWLIPGHFPKSCFSAWGKWGITWGWRHCRTERELILGFLIKKSLRLRLGLPCKRPVSGGSLRWSWEWRPHSGEVRFQMLMTFFWPLNFYLWVFASSSLSYDMWLKNLPLMQVSQYFDSGSPCLYCGLTERTLWCVSRTPVKTGGVEMGKNAWQDAEAWDRWKNLMDG